MKTLALIIALPIALGAGYFLGQAKKQAPAPTQQAPQKSSQTRTTARPATTLEPAVAFDRFLSTKGSDRERLLALTESLDYATTEDLERLHRTIAEDSDFSNWTQAAIAKDLLFQKWAELDPQGALNAASKEDLWSRQAAFNSIFQTVAKDDPSACWDLALAQPTGPLTRIAKTAALAAISITDPLAAFQLYQENPDLDSSTLFSNWAKLDPSAALAATSQIKGANRVNITGKIIGQLFKTDQVTALAEAEKLTGATRQAAFNSILGNWRQADPWAAAEWAAEDPQRFSERVLSGFASKLAAEDPNRAVAWLDKALTGERKTKAMQQVFRTWAGTDPKGAVAWLKTLDGAGLQRK